ncbi:hypothetical protein [Catenulispora rubra]|uniref:hypothetical protein n=1 Tax=Catenulispora rubra TaxID=280293 RepID=UPI001892455A|nr:hypothetical protein [Catenulispora rubra]
MLVALGGALVVGVAAVVFHRWHKPVPLGAALIFVIVIAGGSGVVGHFVGRPAPAKPTATSLPGDPSSASSASSPSASVTSASQTPPPKPVASFSAPSLNATILRCSNASGTSKNIPQGQVLWIVVRSPKDDDTPGPFWLTSRLTPNTAGAWTQPVSVGDHPDTGRPYWLDVWMMSDSSSAQVDKSDYKTQQWRSMPADATLLSETRVVRGDDNAPSNNICPGFSS